MPTRRGCPIFSATGGVRGADLSSSAATWRQTTAVAGGVSSQPAVLRPGVIDSAANRRSAPLCMAQGQRGPSRVRSPPWSSVQDARPSRARPVASPGAPCPSALPRTAPPPSVFGSSPFRRSAPRPMRCCSSNKATVLPPTSVLRGAAQHDVASLTLQGLLSNS